MQRAFDHSDVALRERGRVELVELVSGCFEDRLQSTFFA